MDTEQRKHIAATIRAARLRKGWTVTEAARHLGAGESNWSRWETGTATPRPSTMLELADLLDLPADWATVQHPATTVNSVDAKLAELVAEVRRLAAQQDELLEELKGRDNERTQLDTERQGRVVESDPRPPDS